MPFDFPDFDDVLERFSDDVCASIEAFNEAAKFYGKELHTLKASPLMEKMDIEITDVHTIH